jgi:hypothetical protein
LQTRTNKISGFTNWAFTLGYGFFFDKIKGSLPLPASLIPQTNQKVGESGYALYNMVSTYAADTT